MTDFLVELHAKSTRSLNAAKLLYERGDFDFAVSRAYYSMFYLAEASLSTQGLSFSRHSAVIAAFGKELVKTGLLPSDLHDALRTAFRARSAGDYDRIGVTDPQDVHAIIERADRFQKTVGSFLLSKGMPLQLGVMISGGGRSLQNLIDRIAAGELNARIAVVVASLSKIKGVQIARDAGMPLVIIRKQDYPNVDSLSKAIVDALERHGVQLALQAGWTCLWHMPDVWYGRVMNIHPALLPRFGGKGYFGHYVHEAVLAAGDSESGCTVHFANNEYDAGPIILQRKVPVLPGDTPDMLAARVFEQECIAYPEAIQLFAQNRLRIVGDRVDILER